MNRRNPLWLGLVGMLWGGTWMEIGDVLWVAGHQFAAILAGGVLAVGAYLIGWYGTEWLHPHE